MIRIGTKISNFNLNRDCCGHTANNMVQNRKWNQRRKQIQIISTKKCNSKSISIVKFIILTNNQCLSCVKTTQPSMKLKKNHSLTPKKLKIHKHFLPISESLKMVKTLQGFVLSRIYTKLSKLKSAKQKFPIKTSIIQQ